MKIAQTNTTSFKGVYTGANTEVTALMDKITETQGTIVSMISPHKDLGTPKMFLLDDEFGDHFTQLNRFVEERSRRIELFNRNKKNLHINRKKIEFDADIYLMEVKFVRGMSKQARIVDFDLIKTICANVGKAIIQSLSGAKKL